MRIVVLLGLLAAGATVPCASYAVTDGVGNEKIRIGASDVPLLGTQNVPNVHAPLSGSLYNGSTPALGTTAVAALSACSVGGSASPPTGCSNGTGRSYLSITNQNHISGAAGLVCYSFGAIPATCIPGQGSHILQPGQNNTWEGTEVPPDQVNWTCGTGTCAALLESK